MSEPITWPELHRCDDLLQARAVVTAIAAMEFDVRIRAGGAPVDEELSDDEAAQDFPGPYIIEVPEADWPTLKESLDEIIREQAEFDWAIEIKHQPKRVTVKHVVITAVIVFAILLTYWLFAWLG